MKILKRIAIIFLTCVSLTLHAENKGELKESFDRSNIMLKTIGRGENKIENGVLQSKDAYVCFGNSEWSNYIITFKARSVKTNDQVQIWCGFRNYNRFDRYVLGLKGGTQNEIYLSRMGYMGTDELLAVRPLDFSLKVDIWYDVKIEVFGSRIRVFLNNETLPRVDVLDKNSKLAPKGEVSLGGSWLETEFDDLSIVTLPDDYVNNTTLKEYKASVSNTEKEKKRKNERALYKPLTVEKVSDNRTEVSLNGNWLFMPDYELNDKNVAVSESTNDQNWHVMQVPSFWNPIRIWLHGEKMAGGPSKGVSDTYFNNETLRCEGYTFDYKKTKVAWYRQWVNLPEGVSNKSVVLNFDAVSKIAEVYINGKMAGNHVGMFGSFSVDGTKLFKTGKNLIVVKVVRDYVKEISEGDKIVDVAVSVPVTNKMLKDIAHGFYGDDPAGIWQPVKMVISDPVKIEDVFIKPMLDGSKFDITIKNHSDKAAKFDLQTDIVDNQTNNNLYSAVSLKKISLAPNEEKVISYVVSNLKPKLWSPQSPNLYNFSFKLVNNNREIDRVSIVSGFKTFEVKNGLFYLNGKPYWLRGANHTPFALAPNDIDLANTFYQLMKKGNVDFTRTHTSPYNELWMDAADRNGIGVSFEGTWPWLMIKSSMPEQGMIDMWANEFLDLLKKYRNHPSLFFWTVNNEMKFYDNEPDFEIAKKKMKIISDVVKRMRTIDPTRPVCFDSNYSRNEAKFGKDFFKDIDDGDIDDVHSYNNWYNHSFFEQFNGEFQKEKNEGRPLISQEMSTGYPNNETGHATRFYNLVHQTPQSLIGYQSYEYANPAYFLNTQAMITGELAEVLRRSNENASGIVHFALLTWFRNVYDYKTIEPYPTYYAIQRALQPVLVSAEIWGRHFYAGQQLPTRICVVNDRESGVDLQPTSLEWEMVAENGTKLVSGKMNVPAVKYYGRQWVEPTINIPESLTSEKMNAKLVLHLKEDGKVISSNEYNVLLANKSWNTLDIKNKNIVVLADDQFKSALNYIGVKYVSASSVSEVLKTKADLYIFSKLLPGKNCTKEELMQIKDYVSKGGKVLLSSSKEASKELFPNYITGWIIPSEGDIANMEIPESPVFDNIGVLETRYFNNNKREMPTVCDAALKVNRDAHVVELESHMKIHGYINGEMDERSEFVKNIKGYTILDIKEGDGDMIISTMALDKANTDPVAGKLLSNMIQNLVK